MGKDNGSDWGAKIERGIVRAVRTDAKGIMRYTVESYDRPGIIAGNITNATNLLPSEGMKVCFFMFCDGTGNIVGKLQ